MERINETKLPSEADVIMLKASTDIPDEWKEARFFAQGYLSTLKQVCEEQYCFDGEVINRGYPNDNREAICYLEPYTNLGIFESGQCKKGAFEFIKYVLTYPEIDPYATSDSSTYFWTVNSVREDFFNRVKTGENELEYKEDDITFTNNILSSARVLPYKYRLILDIVDEEASAYFAGGKDAEQTAKVINSRVQLYLGENK